MQNLWPAESESAFQQDPQATGAVLFEKHGSWGLLCPGCVPGSLQVLASLGRNQLHCAGGGTKAQSGDLLVHGHAVVEW